MPTVHIEAEKSEIAEVVLMPGDPLRAKFIADNYLEDVKLFNSIRNMLGYTGYYKGKRVSVMGSGMGIPSMGIYSYELFKYYNVQKIIRIGSCGAYLKEMNLYDIVLATNVYSDSNYGKEQNGDTSNMISSSSNLNKAIEETAQTKGINIIKGNIYTGNVFDPYKEKPNYEIPVNEYNCIATEMEAFALYHNAKTLKREATCVATVSDNLVNKTEISTEKREAGLVKMIELVLESL